MPPIQNANYAFCTPMIHRISAQTFCAVLSASASGGITISPTFPRKQTRSVTRAVIWTLWSIHCVFAVDPGRASVVSDPQ